MTISGHFPGGGLAMTAGCLAALLLVAGCQRTVSGLDTRGVPDPLPAAPVASVQSGTLDPAAPMQLPTPSGQPVPPQDPAVAAQQAPVNQQVAALPPTPPPAPPANSAPVTREAMAGTWTVATDNPDCRIILAFTKWSGGYRAATRRCDTAELSGVTAWDVRDNKVVLVDGSGNQVANLYASGTERYEGSTAGGKRVVFSR